jgi:Ca-activated chloride channel family protein
VKTIALNYSLMSEYTSFVAVDSTMRTAGATGTTVPVAVPAPEGVRYETTVQER